MVEVARPHAQLFTDAGLEPDSLDQLRCAAARVHAASSRSAAGRVRIKGTTRSLTQKPSRARTMVHMRDVFEKNTVGDDKGLIDPWNVVKRVVKSSECHSHCMNAELAIMPAAARCAASRRIAPRSRRFLQTNN